MNDDYLWDKSGEPDPEIAKLERTLSGLGHDDRPLELPETIAPAQAPRRGILGPWFGRGPSADATVLPGVPPGAWAAAGGGLGVAGPRAGGFAIHAAPGW